MIDFIWGDKPSAVFEDNGTYVRVYPIEELRSVFTESGFAIDAIDTCTLGIGAYGPVERFLVNARPTSPASAEA